MKHTKGPWKLLDTKKIIRDSENNDVCLVLARDFSVEGDAGQGYSSEIRVHNAVANAELIAAAPELLEALAAIYALANLQPLLETKYSKALVHDLMRQMQIAIDKARGAS